MTGAELIAIERQRQIDEEGYSIEQDVATYGQLGREADLPLAASSYAIPADYLDFNQNGIPELWPWSDVFWRPTPDDRIKELTKAGALIAAEIDRLLAGEGND